MFRLSETNSKPKIQKPLREIADITEKEKPRESIIGQAILECNQRIRISA
jgi:hypothetical protein